MLVQDTRGRFSSSGEFVPVQHAAGIRNRYEKKGAWARVSDSLISLGKGLYDDFFHGYGSSTYIRVDTLLGSLLYLRTFWEMTIQHWVKLHTTDTKMET